MLLSFDKLSSCTHNNKEQVFQTTMDGKGFAFDAFQSKSCWAAQTGLELAALLSSTALVAGMRPGPHMTVFYERTTHFKICSGTGLSL